MAERPQPAPSDYERSDLALAPIVYAGIGVLLLVIIVPIVISFGMPAVQGDVDRHQRAVPPPPRLQIDPAADLARYRAREQALLGSVGWVDRAHGIAHVPIEDAMQSLVQRGAEGFPEVRQ
ncbi:MAG TPA: hypothetical protein VME21_08555 [Steroidobacteraceae bacterium]|nr:hypothetical protein [Steroidobacteraceae bacterium]